LDLLLQAAVDIVSTMFGDNLAQQLKSIPLSNDTVMVNIRSSSGWSNWQT